MVMVSGNFLEEWVVEKKNSGHTFHGEFRPGHLHTHRPYLDLDFRKNVTWQGRHQQNVTWFKRTVTHEIPGVTVRLT